MKEKKIVFLSYDGITDPLGQSQILPYLFGISSHKNYKITIVSFEKTKNYLQNKDFILNKLSKHNIDWTPLNYTKYPPIFSTIWDIYKLKRTVNKLKNKGLDLIHCRSYITTLVALGFKKKYKTPFIFDMRGFYADERVDGKIWTLDNFIYKKIYNYFKSKEKEFLQYSDYTISLTTNGLKEILSWNLPNQSKLKVIPCCTDETLFQANNIQNVRSELGFNNYDFIISYIGSIGTWYMLDEMLDFFNCLQIKKPTAKFFFITKDDPQLILQKVKSKKIDISSIKIQPSSREMMPSYIGVSNFSIFFILPVFSKKASSPTKMGEIMNLGIPIICNSGVGDVDEIMEKSMPELLVKEFSNNEYDRVIDLIINDYKPNQKSITKTSHSYYSLEKGVEKYKEVYREVLGK
jgi:glycosyltransferase involved in cell wall biosynthesis